MKNYVQEGCRLDLTAPRAVTSGDGFIVGSIFAVASTTATSGAALVGCTEGVFDLTKKTTATFAVGDKVSWDNTNFYCDAPGTGLYPVGVAVAVAGNGGATVRVKLSEVPTTAAA